MQTPECRIPDDSVEVSLHHLHFCFLSPENGLGDEGALHVANALQRNPSLRSLSIAGAMTLFHILPILYTHTHMIHWHVPGVWARHVQILMPPSFPEVDPKVPRHMGPRTQI